MKMSPDLYKKISKMIHDFLDQKTEAEINKLANTAKARAVKSPSTYFVWAIYWKAYDQMAPEDKNIHRDAVDAEELMDKHLETALRSICSEYGYTLPNSVNN